MSDPLTVTVDGVAWHLYAFDFSTPDGVFSSSFYAVSDQHASLLLEELRETAVLRGRVMGVLDAGGADD